MNTRTLHNLLHVLIFPFSVVVAFGLVNETVESIVEKFDVYVHLIFVFFAAEATVEWFRHRRHKHHGKN